MSKLERLSFPKTDINLKREIETEIKEEFERKDKLMWSRWQNSNLHYDDFKSSSSAWLGYSEKYIRYTDAFISIHYIKLQFAVSTFIYILFYRHIIIMY